MSNNIKVLVLAYDFPPFVSVGGLRPYSWHKYLSENEVYPIVITRQYQIKYQNSLDYVCKGISEENEYEESGQGLIIRTPYKPNISNRLLLKYGPKRFLIIRKCITAWYEFFQWFFITGPKKEIFKAADTYLAENKVDAIIATGEPFVLFRFASILSKKYDIPWIADYRDAWCHQSERGNYFKFSWLKWLEIKNVKSSKAIVTVSDFIKFKIQDLFTNKTIFVIPNGYDSEAMESTNSIVPDKETLNIAFVGTIYEWHPYKSFIRVFDSFLRDQPDAKVVLKFYGINKEEEIKKLVNYEFPQIKDNVMIYNRIPNKELLNELAKCHVMLLFNYYSYMGTKIYDYLGLRRKIIICYGNDKDAFALKLKYYRIIENENFSSSLQADLIRKTNSGIVVENENHLKTVFNELYKEFIDIGVIACNSNGYEHYSRQLLVKKLSESIRGIIS